MRSLRSAHTHGALALLSVAAALLFTACGQDGGQDDASPEGGQTLHVRAAGMVQSAGIT